MKKIDKIVQYIDDHNIALAEFERKSGISNGYFKNTMGRGAEISQKILDKIKLGWPGVYEGVFGENNEENGIEIKEGTTANQNDLLTQLMQKQNSLMEMQNRILKEMKEGVQDRVVNIEKDLKKVDSNLENALGFAIRLETFSEAARTVILESLARLEKKPEGSLIGEVNKMIRPSSGL